ncbi:hypothetical protein Y032_0027g1577 [Ancylostoma ceylanicum]|uniref:Uncharacterized protein n=1 Tax=Ancylostoma ceylanicum TaxID=53326 RepID=A0A016UUC3_9BILA|nr:hypothetical protein Y032_0027g1577 [Ancylostoma ceylanicum]
MFTLLPLIGQRKANGSSKGSGSGLCSLMRVCFVEITQDERVGADNGTPQDLNASRYTEEAHRSRAYLDSYNYSLF